MLHSELVIYSILFFNTGDVEDHQLGGFHPMHIGDAFASGRYRILPKSGFGGSSTI
ncbi:hypothetical protein J3R30DRAFT_1221944 [Lentinula aciculospora]|uniref:Uncharacterized protein n=1 Tax=Lentinula aciculospora TaxID=153920 RepID=A0A9W8ZZ40_9AGAR|nr:hypothetical protein J3R30DRAFT_1221944 [Lentinula aciculospora]